MDGRFFNKCVCMDISDNGSMVFLVGSLFILGSDMEVVMPVIAFNTESANYSQKIEMISFYERWSLKH